MNQRYKQLIIYQTGRPTYVVCQMRRLNQRADKTIQSRGTRRLHGEQYNYQ